MKTWLVTVVVFAWCGVALRADITITQSRTVEGKAAVLMPAAGLPKTMIRVKGMKARSDVETYGQTVTIIADLDARQVIMLRPGSNIAQVITLPPVTSEQLPKIDVSLKRTGKSKMIEGASCDEHSFVMRMDMASVPHPHVPPEAMKDVTMRITGSIWIASSAPGAAEWTAFNKAALESKLLSPIASVASEPWVDRLLEASADVTGIPYLIEMTMRYEGSGAMADMMKGMGDMKMVHKVTAVSTEPLAADLFKLPAGYSIEKR